jgi:hypothetical protein
MSEDLSYLTDEDLEAIDAIVEGAHRTQMGENILRMWEEGDERHKKQSRSLLDAIAQAHQAKASEAEADKQ